MFRNYDILIFYNITDSDMGIHSSVFDWNKNSPPSLCPTLHLLHSIIWMESTSTQINSGNDKPSAETVRRLTKLPVMKTKAGPLDGDLWLKRLEEEYVCLIKFVEICKANDSDWFKIESNEDGTHWFGTCWHIHNHVKYEFDVEFDIPVSYPTSSPEIELPQLDGKTAKMYRGGKICLTDHFYPLWTKNVPKFGIVHALALGLAPWLNAEIPYLVQEGILTPPNTTNSSS